VSLYLLQPHPRNIEDMPEAEYRRMISIVSHAQKLYGLVKNYVDVEKLEGVQLELAVRAFGEEAKKLLADIEDRAQKGQKTNGSGP